MGVSAVQGCDACKMLSLQSTKEALPSPFLQLTGFFAVLDTCWYILVQTLYILVHTWSVLSMYKGIPRMILLCCSCAGYCTGCSTISILHRGRAPWCCLGSLVDCTAPALLQLPPVPKGQKIAYDRLPQNRPRLYLLPLGSPTIPHKYSKNKASCFPAGCADAAEEDGRRCSNVYEVNPWLWQFWRGKPRILVTSRWTDNRGDCREAGCCPQIIGQA